MLKCEEEVAWRLLAQYRACMQLVLRVAAGSDISLQVASAARCLPVACAVLAFEPAVPHAACVVGRALSRFLGGHTARRFFFSSGSIAWMERQSNLAARGENVLAIFYTHSRPYV